MENKYFTNINIKNHLEKEMGSSLDKMLNEYYQHLNEGDQLIARSSIADMNQIVVSTPDKPIIGTRALDTCFGILFYDRKNKFGICGHADPYNTFGIIVEMLKQIPESTEGIIEYTIVPGYRAMKQQNFEREDEIDSILRTYISINPKIHFTSLVSNLNPSMPEGLFCYDFAFDTSSGKDVTDLVFRNLTEEQNKIHI